MFEELKKLVVEANKELPKLGLVKYSWGNVSAVDRGAECVVIKPVGLPYDELTEENISVVDMKGKVIEGPFNPSVDLPTHIELYRAFKGVNAIVHTHSTYATMWAQACQDIPCFGTTHADYFFGSVPCTRTLELEETGDNYEEQTGKIIIERFRGIDPVQLPAVLVANHGPFTWGEDPWDAIHKSVVLEEIAKMALGMKLLSPGSSPIPKNLLDRHFLRKHGAGAYFDNDDYGKGSVKNT